MAYDENSTHSPLEAGADITQANVTRVPNNPFNPAVGINFPAQYDAFINKTNDQMSSVNVTEEHSLSEISGSTLYLQHRPRLNGSVTVSDGTLDSNIDYNNGVVTFTALPAGDFTVTYLADPDKYYGEYLNTLQDAVMELQQWAGAGSTAHEGIKNANIALLSTGGNIDSRLTNATNLSALPLDTDVSIKSDTGQSNTITLGNASDTVVVDSNDVDLTLNTTDRVNVKGKLVVAEEGTSVSLDSGSVGHVANAALYTDAASDVAVFYGDVKIFGDVLTDGNITTNTNTTTTNVLAQDLQVDGNTVLGDSTADTTTVSGPLAAGNTLTVASTSTFNDNITLAANKTVDGVDLKALSSELQYMRPGGPDWKGNSVNVTHFLPEAYSDTTATQSIGYSGTVTTSYVGSNVFDDSTATAGAYATTSLNAMNETYDDVYTDGTWFLKFTSGARSGEIFSVISGPLTSSPSDRWTLDRICDGVNSDSYIVYSPYRNKANHLTAAGRTVTLNASAVNPVVCTVGGNVHVFTDSSNTITVPSSTNTYNIFLNTDSSGNPEIFYGEFTEFVSAPGSVWLGHAYVSSGSISQVRPARPNQKYDSGWIYLTAGSDTLPHNLGLTTAGAEIQILRDSTDVASIPSQASYITEATSADAEITGTNTLFYQVSVTNAGYYRIIVSRQ